MYYYTISLIGQRTKQTQGQSNDENNILIDNTHHAME